MGIGGNITATVQVKSGTGKNAIGETVQEWSDLGTLLGYLDNQDGDMVLQDFNTALQETTDIFICDYKQLNGMHFTSENARLVIEGNIFNILMIDDVSGGYSVAAEPPVRRGESHLSGLTEPPFCCIYSYCAWDGSKP